MRVKTSDRGRGDDRTPCLTLETARSIARGEVDNAISGTIELPINLRSLARNTNGASPITLHAFRVTGPVIREARASLFWKDDRSVGYVVDGVPPDFPVVLAATIEPGLVTRILVPTASPKHPARGQTIDERSELIVMRAYLAGLMPPVGLGGTAEVLRQGGFDPAGAADANRKAAEALRQVAASEWGQALPEAAEVAKALDRLAEAQRTAASNASSPALEALPAAMAAMSKVSAFAAKAEERAKASPPPATVAEQLTAAAARLRTALASDVPKPADIVPVPGPTYHLAAANGFFKDTTTTTSFGFPEYPASPGSLASVYESIGYAKAATAGFTSGGSKPFTEAEIAAALAQGKGPYRTSCSQVSFGGETNCKIVINPLDRSQEVLLEREANLFTKKLEALEAAVAANDAPKIQAVINSHPALANFIADDKKRWTSPVGTWRMRLLQDAGLNMIGGAGFPVLSDAEMNIAAAANQDSASSGTFTGVLAIWMPNLDFTISVGGFGFSADNLSNFAMRFDWDEQDRSLLNGELRGERRNGSDGAYRVDYSASFEGQMELGNRILGYWFNDDRGMAGRFELIRGTAEYTIP